MDISKLNNEEKTIIRNLLAEKEEDLLEGGSISYDLAHAKILIIIRKILDKLK